MNKELSIKTIEDVLRRFLILDQYKDKRYAYNSGRSYNVYDIAEEIYNELEKNTVEPLDLDTFKP